MGEKNRSSLELKNKLTLHTESAFDYGEVVTGEERKMAAMESSGQLLRWKWLELK